jgi:hypothetical protein
MHLSIDVSAVERSYMPERRVTIGSKGVPAVWRDDDYVARFRDDVNAGDRARDMTSEESSARC